MTLHDLDWRPARIGYGFVAEHPFKDGNTAFIRTEDVTPEGETYRLTLRTSDGRFIYSKDGLDRTALNARLSYLSVISISA